MTEDRELAWQILQSSYLSAITDCDPIEFAQRQKSLLLCIAEYLIERDKPSEDDMHDKIEKIQKMVKKEKDALAKLKKADVKQDKKMESCKMKKKK